MTTIPEYFFNGFSAPIRRMKHKCWRSPNARTRRPVGNHQATESDEVLFLSPFPASGDQSGESTNAAHSEQSGISLDSVMRFRAYEIGKNESCPLYRLALSFFSRGPKHGTSRARILPRSKQ